MTKPLGAVLFDLYGTLLAFGDMEQAWHAWGGLIYRRLEEAGGTIDMEAWPDLLEAVFDGREPEPSVEGLTVHEARLMQLAQKLGARIGPDDARAMATDGLALWQQEIELAPDVRQVITTLRERGYATGLVTNFDHPPHVDNLIEEHDLRPLLDVVVVSGAVGIKKPDPAIMRLALQPLGVSPAEAVFVGDSPEDVQAARGAGMLAVGISHEGDASRLEAVAPDYWVTSLRQVLDWLAERTSGDA